MYSIKNVSNCVFRSVTINVLPLLSCTSIVPGMFLSSSCSDAFPVLKSELVESAVRLTTDMIPEHLKAR
jgi:hypothetical protein